jgi:hypothetical protein
VGRKCAHFENKGHEQYDILRRKMIACGGHCENNSRQGYQSINDAILHLAIARSLGLDMSLYGPDFFP